MVDTTNSPPPNGPRVLQDGELRIERHTMPVLISGNQRLIVFTSEGLAQLQPGMQGTLIHPNREQQSILIGDIDRLSMIVRYEVG